MRELQNPFLDLEASVDDDSESESEEYEESGGRLICITSSDLE